MLSNATRAKFLEIWYLADRRQMRVANTDRRLKRQHSHEGERSLGRRRERAVAARERTAMCQLATGALYLVTELDFLRATPRDREPEAEVRDHGRRRSPGLE